MSAGREGRHAQRPATKEVFYRFSIIAQGGADLYAVGGHSGIRVDANAEYAYCECYLPHDFKKLIEATVVFLSLATLTPMTFRVVTDWCQAEANYFQHNNLINYSVATVLNRVQGRDISSALITLGGTAGLQAKDYLGVQVSSQAGPPAQNTNAMFLGVRIKYK